MLPTLLRTGGARLYLMILQTLQKIKKMAAAIAATSPKSGKTIDGVRKRSSGKRGKHTPGGGADIFLRGESFCWCEFWMKITILDLCV